MASLLPYRKVVLASTLMVLSFLLSRTRAQTECSADVNCGPGTCVPQPDSYLCVCPSGHTGSNCETVLCDLCENGASCDEMTSECVCAAGYTGSTCSAPIFSCDSIDCGMGYCVSSGESNYSCACLSGYTGTNCDELLLPCATSPCLNGGSCIETNAEGEPQCQMGNNCSLQEDFLCRCLPEYTGQLCDTQLYFTCEYDGSAGVEWEDTISGISLYQPCHSVDESLRGSNIVRLCSGEGQWNELDFSQCTIEKDAPPFLLLWVVVVAENREQVDFTGANMENEVQQFLGVQEEVLVSHSRVIDLSDSFFSVTFKAEFAQNVSDLPQSLNITELDTLGDLTVQEEGRGYRGFLPSDICRCAATTEDSVFQNTCRVVNNNQDTSPCSCTQNTGCQCAVPFYTGDGEECAMDSDGDGYPDTTLSSCSSSDSQSYCSQDLCPNTYSTDNTETACEVLDDGFTGCRSGIDMWGFEWSNAEAGEEAIVTCPDGQGTATRVCGSMGWEPPQVLECGSSDFVSAQQEAEEVFDNTGESLEERLNRTATITEELLAASIPRDGESHLPADLNSTNVIIAGVVGLLEDTLSSESNVTHVRNQNILDIFNNILDPNNFDGWTELQDANGGAEKLLDTAERYSLYLAMAANDSQSRGVWQRENIVIGVTRYSPSSEAPVVFPESLDDLENTTYAGSITAQITIPSSLLAERQEGGEETIPVTSTIVRGMERVLQAEAENPEVTRMVASQVLSTQVSERNRGSSAALEQEPVMLEFTFDSVENASEFLCAYWKFSDPVGSGEWAFDGVEMVSNTSSNGTVVVKCQAMHLTSFAVLVDVSGTLSGGNGTGVSDAELQALTAVSYIGCALSLACLLLAIIFYLSLRRNLFTQVHYFVHLNLAIALFLAYLVFVLGIQLARKNTGGCIFVAALLQYLFLSAFCWMMCEGVMLYLMLVVVFSELSKKWWFFLLLGWVPALVPVVVGVGARHNEYGVENDRGELEYCWLSTEKGVIWAFVAPMIVIIIINVFFLIIALVKVFQSRRLRGRYDTSKVSVSWDLFKALFRATVVLLPILGLTWVFGLFAVNRNATWLAWLFTIFNTMQGVFIFIFHVLLSDKFWQNSRIKKMREKTISSFKSSYVGSTLYSTFRRSEVSSYSISQSGGSKVKYRPSGDKPISFTDISSKSVTQMSLCISEQEREEQPDVMVASDENDCKDPEKGMLESTSADCDADDTSEDANIPVVN